MTPGGSARVVVEGVGHVYGGGARRTTVLHDVDLALPAGCLAVLAGPSGSGKSTLCHLVAGVERPATGRISVGGADPVAVRDWARLAFVPQRLGLVGELTVGQNVELPCRLRGRALPDGLLGRLHLAGIAGRPAGRTSLGEQQRTAVARATALTPAVVVLDEPTSHQDDAAVTAVLGELLRCRDDGSTVLVASHDEAVLAVADVVVHLAAGSLRPR